MARTGFAFASFALGGLGIALLLFPLVRLRAADRDDQERETQRLISRGFGLYLGLQERLGLLRVTVEGADRLAAPGPQLFVANHPSLIDVVALLSRIPECDCVVKREAFENPFQRGVVRGTGYIPNDQGQAVVEACAARLRRGRSVLLFPEGTRSPEGGLGVFRRGAARVALESGCDLVPVVITCDPPTLMRGQPWWEVPDRQIELRLRVEEPVVVKPYLESGDPRPVAARKLNAALRERFEKHLARAEACRPRHADRGREDGRCRKRRT